MGMDGAWGGINLLPVGGRAFLKGRYRIGGKGMLFLNNFLSRGKDQSNGESRENPRRLPQGKRRGGRATSQGESHGKVPEKRRVLSADISPLRGR